MNPRRRPSRAAAAAVVLAGTMVLTGCAAGDPPVPHPTADSASAGRPMTSKEADAFFERTICPVESVYEAANTALTVSIGAEHAAARTAAATYRGVQRRMSSPPGRWPSKVAPLMPAFDAQLGKQAAYYDAVQKAPTLGAAASLVFPDGTAVTVPVESALGVPDDFPCPAS